MRKNAFQSDVRCKRRIIRESTRIHGGGVLSFAWQDRNKKQQHSIKNIWRTQRPTAVCRTCSKTYGYKLDLKRQIQETGKLPLFDVQPSKKEENYEKKYLNFFTRKCTSCSHAKIGKSGKTKQNKTKHCLPHCFVVND